MQCTLIAQYLIRVTWQLRSVYMPAFEILWWCTKYSALHMTGQLLAKGIEVDSSVLSSHNPGVIGHVCWQPRHWMGSQR